MAEPEYTFNPIQARKELQIGDFYFKKGRYRAAAGRYDRASKWQPGLAEAYYKLGVARERTNETQQALDAYRKYLAAAPSSRRAPEVKKKITDLQRKPPKPDERPDPRPTASPP